MKVDVLFARFPFGNAEAPDSSDWLMRAWAKCVNDKRIGRLESLRVDDTPITMSRNRALKYALDQKFDYCVMLDSDLNPDLPDQPNPVPFWEAAFPFALEHNGPCVIAAPYCGPPPYENVYVFRWGNREQDHPNHGRDLFLDQYSREEAYMLSGVHEAAALPTGLMLIDMRAIARLPAPWFEYEWADPPFNTKKASTEDVFFSRNLSICGVRQYCTWSSWAGHWKRKCVGRPMPLTTDIVNGRLREAVSRGTTDTEKLITLRGSVDPNREAAGISPLRRPNRVTVQPLNVAEEE